MNKTKKPKSKTVKPKSKGKPRQEVCDVCGRPIEGLLCRHSFYDFVTGELVHD